jgi:hypothetical protein
MDRRPPRPHPLSPTVHELCDGGTMLRNDAEAEVRCDDGFSCTSTRLPLPYRKCSGVNKSGEPLRLPRCRSWARRHSISPSCPLSPSRPRLLRPPPTSVHDARPFLNHVHLELGQVGERPAKFGKALPTAARTSMQVGGSHRHGTPGGRSGTRGVGSGCHATLPNPAWLCVGTAAPSSPCSAADLGLRAISSCS